MNINGLMGYYFEDEYFSKVNLMAQTYNNKLTFKKDNILDLCLEQTVKAVRWIGFIEVKDTDDYIFSVDIANCIIQINGKTLSASSTKLPSIRLNKGVKYDIRIEQLLDDEVKLKNIQSINLFYERGGEKQIVPTELLFKPDYSNVDGEIKFIPDENFFFRIPRTRADIVRDSDNDGIPDDMEVNGYTVMNHIITAWDDSYAAKGYKKYVSNPYNARTANDPYTDAEKVTGQIDKSIDLLARNPMVAAYPIIGVQMEKLVVSKNEVINDQVGTSMSKGTSNSYTQSNTVGVDITTEAGYDILPKFNVSVSANYSHTWQNTSSTSNTSGESFSSGLSINKGQAAYINPNVRYRNNGTAPVYNVSPNITVSINGDSVVSVQAQQNQIAQYLNPLTYYPKLGTEPIAFNTMDQFNSHLIQISYDQLKDIDSGKEIKLSVSQFLGEYAKIGIDGSLITNGNNWGPYLGQIESTTASFIFDTPERVREVRIAARNSDDPEDATPILSIREALHTAFDINIVGDEIYYHGMKVFDMSVNVSMDKNTKNELDFQLAQMNNKNFLDCIIRPNMNLCVRIRNFKINVVDNGKYKICSASNKNLTISNNLNTAYICDDIPVGSGVNWEIIYDTVNNAYKVQSLYDNKVLTLVDDNSVSLSNYVDKAINQQWILGAAGDNSYYLVNKKDTNKVLTISDNSHNLIISESKNLNTQKWKLENPNRVEGTWRIVSDYKNNYVLNVKDSNNVNLALNSSKSYQDWILEFDLKKEQYKIFSNKGSNNILICGSDRDNYLTISPFTGADGEYCILTYRGNGKYSLHKYKDTNKLNRAATVFDNQDEDGNSIIMYEFKNLNNQYFKFKRIK